MNNFLLNKSNFQIKNKINNANNNKNKYLNFKIKKIMIKKMI